jgi:predicted ABC-type ATPase
MKPPLNARDGVARRPGRILVAAGTNGAGKSAIVGEFLAAKGGAYFNPDLVARELIQKGVSTEHANATAWKLGFNALQRAINNHEDFSFETTLGGNTVAHELHRAIKAGIGIYIWYFGLASPELHIARVRARVGRGGHDIPEAKIRERYPKSLANLVSFIGVAAEVHLFDNSAESADGLPQTMRVMRIRAGKIIEPDIETLMTETPDWAKPVVAAAVKVHTVRRLPRKKK